MGEKPFNQMIIENYTSLSPGQKKVAEYIQGHMDQGALHTAYQIGKKAGVSETTVIRFAYALGFTGFSNLQEKIRRDWLNNKQSISSEVSASKEDRKEVSIFENIVEREKQVLDQLLLQVHSDELWIAIDSLTIADKVYIGGFGSSYAASFWLYYSLKQLRADVFISGPNGFMPEDVNDLSEHSIVVIFSYPRYRKEALQLAKMAKLKKAKTLLITNRLFSPIGQVADCILTTEEHVESSHNSIASVISLLEVLLAGIQKKDEKRISSRQQQLELLYSNQQLFLE